LFNEFTKLDSLKSVNYSSLVSVDSLWFYKKRRVGESVASLYYRLGDRGKEILLFDPTKFEKGKILNIRKFTPSPHGKYITIETASGGGEVATIRLMKVSTHQFYKDSIYPSLYGVTGWLENDSSFFYVAHSSLDPDALAFHENTRVMLHRLGTSTSNDREIFSARKYNSLGILPEEICWAMLDPSKKYLIGYLFTASVALHAFYCSVADLKKPEISWKPLFEQKNEVSDFYIHGKDLYFLTFHGAPRYKICKTNIDAPDLAGARVVFDESLMKIEEMNGTKDYLIVRQTDGINDKLWKYNFNAGNKEEILPKLSGSLSIDFAGPKTNRCTIGATGWNHPYTRYQFNMATNAYSKSIFDESISYPGIDKFEIREVEVPAKDGVMVPLSIMYKKGTGLDGNNSCILTGYGCYGISYSPFFSIMNLALIQKGVVVAFAHVRGGGEKGEDWHQAGYKKTKPNTWNDFIACSEYLIEKGYTRKEKLAGTGTSAGGILISRAVTSRPDLYAAAVCNVGDADALRSEWGTDGPSNSKEYGSVKDSVECMALIEMDGLHHVTANTNYPAVLCATGMNDARVAPWQPGKFTAAVQKNSISGKPVLLRVDYNNGHFTENRIVTYNNFADQYAFLLWQTGHPDFN
jgi:prolyl oligopeptidase